MGVSIVWLEKGIGEEKRWFYPISAFLIGAAIYVTDLWNMFFPHIQAHFGLQTTASIVVAATFCGLGVMVIGPPIAGVVVDKYGPKLPFIMSLVSLLAGHGLLGKMLTLNDWSTGMYLWYIGSLLVGLGLGFYGGTYTATIGKWFPDKVGTAMGLAVAGLSGATIIYSPLLGSYIKSHGFGANIFLFFAIIAVVFLGGVGILGWKTPAPTWVPDGMQPKCETSAAKSIHVARDYTFQEAIKDKMFWILCLCFVCAAFSSQLFVQNASLIVIEGLSKTMSKQDVLVSVIPLFVSLTGIALLTGRFAWGVITDKLGGPWKTLWMVYLFAAILIGLFYVGYHSKILIFIIGFLLYFCMYGGTPVVHYAIVPYVFGRRHIGKIMNILNAISVGIGMAVGPFLGAYIKDVTGGYLWALMVAIIIRVCGTAFALLGLRLSGKKQEISVNTSVAE